MYLNDLKSNIFWYCVIYLMQVYNIFVYLWYVYCSKGNLEVVRILLEYGCNFNVLNDLGQFLFYIVVKEGYWIVVQEFINKFEIIEILVSVNFNFIMDRLLWYFVEFVNIFYFYL